MSQTQSHSNFVQLLRLRGGRRRANQRGKAGGCGASRPNRRTSGPWHTCSREAGQTMRVRKRQGLCPTAPSHRRRRPARAWPAPAPGSSAAGRQRGILHPSRRGREARQACGAGTAPAGLCGGRVRPASHPPNLNNNHPWWCRRRPPIRLPGRVWRSPFCAMAALQRWMAIAACVAACAGGAVALQVQTCSGTKEYFDRSYMACRPCDSVDDTQTFMVGCPRGPAVGRSRPLTPALLLRRCRTPPVPTPRAIRPGAGVHQAIFWPQRATACAASAPPTRWRRGTGAAASAATPPAGPPWIPPPAGARARRAFVSPNLGGCGHARPLAKDR